MLTLTLMSMVKDAHRESTSLLYSMVACVRATLRGVVLKFKLPEPSLTITPLCGRLLYNSFIGIQRSGPGMLAISYPRTQKQEIDADHISSMPVGLDFLRVGHELVLQHNMNCITVNFYWANCVNESDRASRREQHLKYKVLVRTDKGV
jgi:hypothetical protein